MPYNYAIVNNIFVLRQRRATPLATLIGAEGITAAGSYTWSNLWLLIDCALEKIDSPFKQYR